MMLTKCREQPCQPVYDIVCDQGWPERTNYQTTMMCCCAAVFGPRWPFTATSKSAYLFQLSSPVYDTSCSCNPKETPRKSSDNMIAFGTFTWWQAVLNYHDIGDGLNIESHPR